MSQVKTVSSRTMEAAQEVIVPISSIAKEGEPVGLVLAGHTMLRGIKVLSPLFIQESDSQADIVIGFKDDRVIPPAYDTQAHKDIAKLTEDVDTIVETTNEAFDEVYKHLAEHTHTQTLPAPVDTVARQSFDTLADMVKTISSELISTTKNAQSTASLTDIIIKDLNSHLAVLEQQQKDLAAHTKYAYLMLLLTTVATVGLLTTLLVR